jgi:hypothetical protein
VSVTSTGLTDDDDDDDAGSVRTCGRPDDESMDRSMIPDGTQ